MGRRNQSGLALITAVLVVAIVATTAASLALGEQVWFRQAQNSANRAQAESLRQGALSYATILLTREFAINPNVDHLGEAWAQPIPPFPVEDGMLAFQVSDAQGLFNLNNLVNGGTASQPDVDMFKRLLQALNLNPDLGHALLDWLDSNHSIDGVGGAEDTEYLALPQPYRAANRLLESVDELRLVRGFDAKTVEKLRPYVTVLPIRKPINVNTAPELVLAAMFTNPPVAALKPLLDSRVSQPFKVPADFTARLPTGTSPQVGYGVATEYFLVTIEIRYGRLQRRTLALIQRAAGRPAVVLWHQLPPLIFATDKDEEA